MHDDVTKTKPCAVDRRSPRRLPKCRVPSEHRPCRAVVEEVKNAEERFGLRENGVARCVRVELRLFFLIAAQSREEKDKRVRSRGNAVHLEGLAKPWRGMGEDRRGLGEEEDPRVRQQQDALAVATVSEREKVSDRPRRREEFFFHG